MTSLPIDRAEAARLRAQGLGWPQIAATLGCSTSGARAAAGSVEAPPPRGADDGATVASARALMDFGLTAAQARRLLRCGARIDAAAALPAGPKPRLRVRRAGSTALWWVEAARPGGAVAVSAPVSCEDLAWGRLALIERLARVRARACLCCRATFLSEGPHNRLCVDCTRRGEAVCPLRAGGRP